jgi:RHS repeat-associated protein
LDHLGTPRLITDTAGNPATAKFHTYYPFGEEIARTFTTSYTDRMRLTGHERDLANIAGQGDDLDYMHAKHHNPLIGRFLSTDRVSGNPRAPQSWNRYSYALGRPLLYVDPDGNKARVFRDGNRIRIEIPARYKGIGATPDRIAAFERAVQTKWSGTFGKFEVETKVVPGGFFDNKVHLSDQPSGADRSSNVSYVTAGRFAKIFVEPTDEAQAEVDAQGGPPDVSGRSVRPGDVGAGSRMGG